MYGKGFELVMPERSAFIADVQAAIRCRTEIVRDWRAAYLARHPCTIANAFPTGRSPAASDG